MKWREYVLIRRFDEGSRINRFTWGHISWGRRKVRLFLKEEMTSRKVPDCSGENKYIMLMRSIIFAI